MTPGPDLFASISRLEKENRNLIARLEQLEKRRGFSPLVLIANALLLALAVLLADYLGLLPRVVDRLPLQASTVEAGQVIFRAPGGVTRARFWVDKEGAHLLDDNGKSLLKP